MNIKKIEDYIRNKYISGLSYPEDKYQIIFWVLCLFFVLIFLGILFSIASVFGVVYMLLAIVFHILSDSVKFIFGR